MLLEVRREIAVCELPDRVAREESLVV